MSSTRTRTGTRRSRGTVGEKVASELPTLSYCGGGDNEDKENALLELTPQKAKQMKVTSEITVRAGVLGRLAPAAAAGHWLDEPLRYERPRCAVDTYAHTFKEAKRHNDEGSGDTTVPDDSVEDPLAWFESQCPPDGERMVVLYTTSVHGVRNTFDHYAYVHRILEGLCIAFLEERAVMTE